MNKTCGVLKYYILYYILQHKILEPRIKWLYFYHLRINFCGPIFYIIYEKELITA
jgi:hypothetical protein